MRHSAWRFLAASVLSGSLALANGCKLDSLVFDPTSTSEYHFSSAVVPDSLRTEINFPSGDETLYGVLLRQPGPAPRLTVLLSHGKGGDISRPTEWTRAEMLWQAGFDVIAYDYRGYGKSTGSSTGEPSLLADGQAALAWALPRVGAIHSSLVLYGHSLGAVPTTDMAATLGIVRGVVLESAFASGEAMAHTATLLDVPREWLIDGRFDNVGKLPAIQAPILILAGSEDIQVPRAQTDELYARANNPKRLEFVSGAVHDDIPSRLGSSAYTALLRALTTLP